MTYICNIKLIKTTEIMVLIYTLNDNFKKTTEGLNPATIWVVRIVLAILAIGLAMVATNVLINGAPEISY